MEIFVALLRAINVAGVNSLPMANFRDSLAKAGLTSPQTYVQSGNVVCGSDRPSSLVADTIADTVLAAYGFRPPVHVLTAAQFQAALDSNPFAGVADAATQVHGLFMDRVMPDQTMGFLKSVALPSEQYAVRGRVLWLYLPTGFGRSKLARRVMSLPIGITARNLRSITAIAALAAKRIVSK